MFVCFRYASYVYTFLFVFLISVFFLFFCVIYCCFFSKVFHVSIIYLRIFFSFDEANDCFLTIQIQSFVLTIDLFFP